MARNLFFLFLITFISSTRLCAQETTNPYLANRGVEEHLSWWLNNGELLLEEVELVRNPDTKIAVRFCTKLSFEKAIRLSKAAPYGIADYLKRRDGYTTDRIFILFYKNCPEGEDKRISFYSDTPRKVKKDLDVEVWVVPKNAAFPPSDEIYKFSGIKPYELVKQKK